MAPPPPQPATAGGFARTRSIPEPEAPPEASSLPLSWPRLTVPAAGPGPAGRSARTTAPGRARRPGRPGCPGSSCSTTRDRTAAMMARMARRSGWPCRIRAGSTRASSGCHGGGGSGSVAGADHRERRGDRPVEAVGQVGVGLGPAPGGAELGVGGGRGGVAGQVPAVGPVGVGGGGDRAPGGADLLVGQVGAGGQAERGERVRAGAHRGAPGPKRSSRPPGRRPAGPGRGSRRGLGRRGRAAAGRAAGSRVSGEGRGRATWTKVAVPRLDVAGLPDVQAADQVGVGGPGVLHRGWCPHRPTRCR